MIRLFQSAGGVSCVLAMFFCCLIVPVASFLVPSSVQRHTLLSFRPTRIVRHVAIDTHGSDEYSVYEQAEEEEPANKDKLEYAALSPGCPVRIQVGDVSLARKAWKKRRRSGSPLLVPCSVLDVDRKSMIRNNILYLLQKFGTPLDEVPEGEVGFIGSGNDMAINMNKISRLYRVHLGTSLAQHAKAMGHETARSLVRDLFNKKVQKAYGVRIWLPPREEQNDSASHDEDTRPLWLLAPLSRRQARRMSGQAVLLQFTNSTSEAESEEEEDESRVCHTGIVRSRKKKAETGKSPYEFLPLSAALRVTQSDLDSGAVEKDSIHHALVYSFDLLGDGGNPLLTFSLRPTREQLQNRRKMKEAGRSHFSRAHRLDVIGPEEIERKLEDMKVGEGPIHGKVIGISTKEKAVYIDCGVGRSVSKSKGGGTHRVLGMMPLDDLLEYTIHDDQSSSVLEDRSSMSEEEEDLIESFMDDDDEDENWGDEDEDDDDDDEEEDGIMTLEDLYEVEEVNEADFEFEEGDEDITHLVTTDENGNMVYTDPDTGVMTILDAHDHDHDDETDDAEDDEENPFAGLNPEERLEKLGEILSIDEDEEEESDEQDEEDSFQQVSTFVEEKDSFAPSFVEVGDDIEVFVKSVSKQAGRFTVTLDPSFKGRKAKDLKRETEVEKKLSRLVERMGGEKGYQKILALAGTECDGTVKATSKTGDWFYVQPNLDDMPVGVAKLSDDSAAALIAQGDSVRVRLDGIDESRGQLAMTIIQ